MADLAVVDLETGELTNFEPQATARKMAQADAVIEYAQRVKDWPALEQAVDLKIEEQKEFVGWWKDHVSVNHGGVRSKSADRGTWSVDRAEELTGISSQQVSKWAKAIKDEPAYRARLYGAAWKKAMGQIAEHRIKYNKEDEWYTPAEYIESARSAMGGIDLDPASSERAQEVVKATEFFTAERSGLGQPWHGRVWMNPPYSQPLIVNFIEKLCIEVTEGRVEQAVVVTHNSTDTAWFHRLNSVSALLCFTRGRVAFKDPHGDRSAPTQGSCFFYVGDRLDEFRSEFSEYGFIR